MRFTPSNLLLLSLSFVLSEAASSESFMHCRNHFPKIRDIFRVWSSDSLEDSDGWGLAAHYPESRLESYRRIHPEYGSFPDYVFPAGLSKSSFANLEDLCAHNDARGNAGCKCVEDPATGSNAVNCFPDRPQSHTHFELFTLYRFWCRHYCRCQPTRQYEDQKPVKVASSADWKSLGDFAADPYSDVTRPFSIARQPGSTSWGARMYGGSTNLAGTCSVKASSGGATQVCSNCNERCRRRRDCRSQMNGCDCKGRMKETPNGLAWLGISDISNGKTRLGAVLV
jgi:hypothetical protein